MFSQGVCKMQDLNIPLGFSSFISTLTNNFDVILSLEKPEKKLEQDTD